MFIFGHIGITLGAAMVADRVYTIATLPQTKRNRITKFFRRSYQVVPTGSNHSSLKVPWLDSIAMHGDIRFLIIGSLLPDILDKPIGILFFVGNTRIFCHTFLFLILITLAGLCLWQSRRKTSLLFLSFGTFTHLILDEMWHRTRILLWPLYGWIFPRGDVSWLKNVFNALLTKPEVYIPEIIGAVIFIWFTLALLQRRKLVAFVRYGQVQ